MTNKEAIKLIRGVQAYRLYPKTDPYKALDMAIEALELQSGHLVKESGGLVKDLVKDTIDRRTAIDALNEYFARIGKLKRRGLTKGEEAINLDTVGAIKTLPSVQPDPPWILCSEKMPEEHERVLATHLGGLNPDRQVIEHIYKNGKFTLGWDMDMNMDSPTFGQRYMGKVVAWMPLPKPYKEGDAK